MQARHATFEVAHSFARTIGHSSIVICQCGDQSNSYKHDVQASVSVGPYSLVYDRAYVR